MKNNEKKIIRKRTNILRNIKRKANNYMNEKERERERKLVSE